MFLLFRLYKVNYRAKLIDKDSRNYSFILMGMFKFESTLLSEEYFCVLVSAVSLKSCSLNKETWFLII
jgi:hypothetical protein